MTVDQLRRELELCDPDMEVRLFVEYDEESLKYNGGNVLKRIRHREIYKHLEKISIGEHAIILEGLGD